LLRRPRRAARRRDQRRPRLLFSCLCRCQVDGRQHLQPGRRRRAATRHLPRLLHCTSRSQSVASLTGCRRTPAGSGRPSSSRIAACASVSPAPPSRYRACCWALHPQPANQRCPIRKLAQCIVRSFETACWIRAPHATVPGKPLPAAVNRATAGEPLSC
jgi:hypothetical protein